jgi:hypothetical protein
MHRVVLVLAVLGFTSVAEAQNPPAPAEPTVVMTGEGVVKAAPDQGFVTFGVESRSKNPKDAQAQTAKAMTAVQEKLVAAGLQKDAIRTLSYELHLESDWVNGKQVPRGYVSRNTIEVRVDEIARVGEVIDIAIANGANNVHGVRFDLKQRDALEREALKRATADARARAEAAASGVGATLGRILRIDAQGGYVPPPPMPVQMMRRDMAAESQVATPVIAGEIEIRSTVVLTIQLK